ncbi:carbon-nitrogen hydrolase [Boeremia exigua]|uniref:carbon-nitrogen hydrolase n=1 Tax=Boeremia exigua TaxID=749465 RepID=UPI001E8EC8A6|nr:carbon-nitrogen hydrolase [Boeremia exigua]KAH6616802.1 carbon-nitrogen hydrolase [Boeremia exigua]
MATVTIGRAYFDALLRSSWVAMANDRFFVKLIHCQYTSGQEFELAPDLLSNVIISKVEHDYMQQCSHEYALLKSALFRGGLTMDTLNTLLASESEATDHTAQYGHGSSEKIFFRPDTVPNTTRISYNDVSPRNNDSSHSSDETETLSDHLSLPQPRPLQRTNSIDETESCIDNCVEEEQDHRQDYGHRERIPVRDQRTILISNLAERTTHKDITGIIRGGRLLDIFLRNDRSATVSFVEGAANFLAHIKRNDIYLHAKRLEFRWADRQFHVSPHVSYNIAKGVTRNLVVRGVAGRVTEEQIRDHLDHIHNLIIVDVYFQNGNAHISTNSINNARFARTCMMSRAVYKGVRIEWGPDECAAPLPQPESRTRPPAMRVPSLPLSMSNIYAPLDTSSELDSDSQTEPYIPDGVRLDRNDWANATRSLSSAEGLPHLHLHTLAILLTSKHFSNCCFEAGSSKMASTIKVAVIQMYPKPLDPEHNFNKAADYVRSAAAQGAELAVLPEYHLTNWLPKDPAFVGLCDQWETYLKKYQALAKECGICIVPGTIVEGHRGEQKEEDRLLNVAYFIGADGEIVGKYVKKNLWGPERSHLTSSRHAPHEVFPTPLGNVGLLICWDLAFPEAFRELIAAGAQLIIIPTFWTLNDCSPAGLARNPRAEALFLESVLTARAFENTCAVVFANAAGPAQEGYAGLSQVTVPFLGPVGRLGDAEEGLLVVDVEMGILEEAERNYRIREDIGGEGWHYTYRHDSVGGE